MVKIVVPLPDFSYRTVSENAYFNRNRQDLMRSVWERFPKIPHMPIEAPQLRFTNRNETTAMEVTPVKWRYWENIKDRARPIEANSRWKKRDAYEEAMNERHVENIVTGEMRRRIHHFEMVLKNIKFRRKMIELGVDRYLAVLQMNHHKIEQRNEQREAVELNSLQNRVAHKVMEHLEHKEMLTEREKSLKKQLKRNMANAIALVDKQQDHVLIAEERRNYTVNDFKAAHTNREVDLEKLRKIIDDEKFMHQLEQTKLTESSPNDSRVIALDAYRRKNGEPV